MPSMDTFNTYVIKDTGYIKTSESGTQETSIANSGSEIFIYVKSIQWSFETGIDSTSSMGVFKESQTAVGIFEHKQTSVDNPGLVLQCYYDINNATQLAHLKALERARRTKGVKEFYYKEDRTSAYASRSKNLLDVFGETDTQESTYKHVHVRIKSLNLPETTTSKGKIHFNMVLEVTA